MAQLWSLIEKRHPAPGWRVMFEVANGTGYRGETRYADALAFSIWPSHGYELHGYEIKVSREDLKKELSDPRKADAIGKYVDYWWLVLDDIKLMEGIEIPATWGILAPKGQILKVHRKAPKRKATPMDRAFAAAMIRRVIEHWVPKHVHEAYVKDSEAKAREVVQREFKSTREDAEYRLERMIGEVRRFEEITGVKITKEHHVYGQEEPSVEMTWGGELTNIGEAVRTVVEVRQQHRYWGIGETAAEIVRRELASTERVISQHEQALRQRLATRDRLQAELDTYERQTSGLTTPDGDSPTPPDGHDHAGGGIDRGHTGAPEQDAGVELRDQRPEVPHGQEAPADPR